MSVEEWVNSLSLSKKVRNLARDFSDGVLMAEVVHNFMPKLVDLHNYSQALRVDTKIYNWSTLNQKVFKKIGMTLDKSTIDGLANAKPGIIEKVLSDVKTQLTSPKQQTHNGERKSARKTNKELPMTDADRQLLIQKIIEGKNQSELIKALELKLSMMMELMAIKDAKIVKHMEKKERTK